jgi:KipI family sensor histidine kinase inhibitor
MTSAVWLPAGDTGLLLDFCGYASAETDVLPDDDVRLAALRQARSLSACLAEMKAAGKIDGITDLVPGMTSLLIHYDPLVTSAQHLKTRINLLMSSQKNTPSSSGRRWHLPVLYGNDVGPDLEEVARRTGLTSAEVIARHLANELEVAIMGFLPGSGYLTGVDASLSLPRRSAPRTHVPQGSVGIAMGQTTIYPLDSPGGWNLIGKMPVPLFDPARAEPIMFRPGDRVKFFQIDDAEFTRLKQATSGGAMPLSPELIGPTDTIKASDI